MIESTKNKSQRSIYVKLKHVCYKYRAVAAQTHARCAHTCRALRVFIGVLSGARASRASVCAHTLTAGSAPKPFCNFIFPPAAKQWRSRWHVVLTKTSLHISVQIK